MKELRPVESHELALFVSNNEKVFTRFLAPTVKSLEKKYKKGIFDTEKAVKAIYNITVEAAKEYAKVFASLEAWYNIFTVADRKAAATEILDDWMDSITGENPIS